MRPLARYGLPIFVLAAICAVSAFSISPHLPAAQAKAPQPHRLVGYFGDWEGYLGAVQFGRLSDLIYSFADEAKDACTLVDGARDSSADFPILRRAKQQYPHLKILLSVGGAGYSSAFPAAVSTQAKINKLVANCMRLIRHTYPHLFDGIDVSWDGPSGSRQQSQFTNLIRAFRKQLGPLAPLSAAVTPRYAIKWKKVMPLLSWVNLMAYYYHPPRGSRVTDFLAPLVSDKHDPERKALGSVTQDVTKMLRRYRVPASKLLLGIPFFGLGFSGVKRAGNGLYRKYKGNTSFGTLAPSQFQYWNLLNNYVNKNGYRRYGPNRYSKEMWLYKPGARHTGIFISYDNLVTIRAKVALVKSHHLGGAMIWTVSGDTSTPKTSLTYALNRGLAPIR